VTLRCGHTFCAHCAPFLFGAGGNFFFGIFLFNIAYRSASASHATPSRAI